MKTNIKKVTTISLFIAIIFIITRFIQIPIPLGYLCLSNAFILLGAILVGFPYGIIIGAVGSSLADLVSFPVYTVPTLIIKGLMPLVFYLCCKVPIKNKYARYFTSGCISMLIPVIGYVITGSFLYGGLEEGLLALPGLIIEYVVNCILFVPLINISFRLKKELNKE